MSSRLDAYAAADTLRCLDRETIDAASHSTRLLLDGSRQLGGECLRRTAIVCLEGVERQEQYRVYVKGENGRVFQHKGPVDDVLSFLAPLLRMTTVRCFKLQYCVLPRPLCELLLRTDRGDYFNVQQLTFMDVDFREIGTPLLHQTILSLPSPALSLLHIDGGELLAEHISDSLLEGLSRRGVGDLNLWPNRPRDTLKRFHVSDKGVLAFCASDVSGESRRLALRYGNISPIFTAQLIRAWHRGKLTDVLDMMLEPVTLDSQHDLEEYEPHVRTRRGNQKTTYTIPCEGDQQPLTVGFCHGPHALVIRGRREVK
ncbi:hypothetical protein AAVH_40217 [Aphelenchoides avenae]|nr:hypothetical protein AAVH_40217 [Aphelenchus avenae]